MAWQVCLVNRIGAVVRKLMEHENYGSALAFAAGFGNKCTEGTLVVIQTQSTDTIDFCVLSSADGADVEVVTDREQAGERAVEDGLALHEFRFTLPELVTAIGGVREIGTSLIETITSAMLLMHWGNQREPAEFYAQVMSAKLTEQERHEWFDDAKDRIEMRGKTLTQVLTETA